MQQHAQEQPSPHPQRPAYFAQEMRSASIMRANLRELNRSMESIERMIEKSRRIINQSRESRESHRSIEKSKEQKSLQTIAYSNSNNTEPQKTSTNKTFYKQITLINNAVSNRAKPPASVAN
jgi:hypothetical protein